jgi:hypothetical protein
VLKGERELEDRAEGHDVESLIASAKEWTRPMAVIAPSGSLTEERPFLPCASNVEKICGTLRDEKKQAERKSGEESQERKI